MNGFRCALAMFSGRVILNFGISERLRAFRYPVFTGEVVEENSICSAAFCESTALQEKLLPAFSRLPHHAAIFPLRPSREKCVWSTPQSATNEKKIILPLIMPRAQRRAF